MRVRPLQVLRASQMIMKAFRHPLFSKIVLTIVILLLQALFWRVIGQEIKQLAGTGPAKGTVIVFVQTKEGLLICADKRVSYDPDNFRDDVTKITPLGTKIAFALAGVPAIEGDNEVLVFSATDTIKEYFSQAEFRDTKEFWTGLQQKVFDNFIKYLQERPYEHWPPTQYPEANHYFFQALFFFLDERGETMIKLIPLK